MWKCRIQSYFHENSDSLWECNRPRCFPADLRRDYLVASRYEAWKRSEWGDVWKQQVTIWRINGKWLCADESCCFLPFLLTSPAETADACGSGIHAQTVNRESRFYHLTWNLNSTASPNLNQLFLKSSFDCVKCSCSSFQKTESSES